ncbi:conserved hypothetical protein [Methylocella tundrae]|uniref:Uncharacterized protein n=1 Tax=Methylocella tundrae TaxID=227605 RepID=A0A8B6M1V1_METTU|nr:hypothetical protein [Methylocella tundrae]VTZ26214.1 conserved hypothetical protein [Methylocella tundrae]VTZ48734.1 conserved hypothetical protein [Methylocella tundrae]
MSENFIHRVIRERDEAHQQLRQVRHMLRDIEHYLTSTKFTNSPDDDYVHVRTDILPKIAAVRFAAID